MLMTAVLAVGLLVVPEPSAAAGLISATGIALGSWAPVPGGPLQARTGAAVVWTGRDLVAWGGESTASDDQGLSTTFANGAAYNRWSIMPPGPLSARDSAASTWTGSEVFVWGGDGLVMSGYRDYSDGALYDPATGGWQLLPRAPLSARRGAEAFRTGSEIVVFGGQGSPDDTALVDGAIFSPAEQAWARLPTFPVTGPGTPITSTAAWTGEKLLAVVTYQRVVRIPCAKTVHVPRHRHLARRRSQLGPWPVCLACPPGGHAQR
jgi:hypothetical protein